MLDFVMLARRLRADGRTVALCDAQPQITALIELVGLDRLPGVRIARATAARPFCGRGAGSVRIGLAPTPV